MDEEKLTDGRRWFQRGSAIHTVDDAPTESPSERLPYSQEIEVSAYTADSRIYGFMRLRAERLSDALNDEEELHLDSVLFVALDDNRAVEMAKLVVHRDELIAIRASGPRGNPARRRRSRPSPVAMRAGLYQIQGYVHAPPGADPLQQFRRRKPMVPLTESWIEYVAAGEAHRARVGTIIVNRHFVDWVDHARDSEIRMELPVEMRIDPRAKDLTGHVRVWRTNSVNESS